MVRYLALYKEDKHISNSCVLLFGTIDADGLKMAKPSRKRSKGEILELIFAIEVIATFDTINDTLELVAVVATSTVIDSCWSQKFFECFGLTNRVFSILQKVVYMVLTITLFT